MYGENSERVVTFNAGITLYTAEKNIVAFGFGGVIAQDADLGIVIYRIKYDSVFYRLDSLLKQIDDLKSNIKGYDSIPSYYFVDNYIDNKISDINNTIANSSTSFDMFTFYTDIHLGANVNCKTPMLLKYLYDNTPINKAFFGGDIIDAYGGASHLFDNIKEYLKLFAKGNIGLDCFNIRGNHDFTIKDSQDASTGDTLSKIKTHNILQLSNEWLGNAIYNDNDEIGNYFYVDNPTKHIRYIAIDTTDEVQEGQAWGTLVSIDKTQYEWIVEKAIKPIKNGWNIILLSHIPFLLGAAGESTYNFSQFIKAYNEQRTFSWHNVTYDFSDYTSKIVACISGHEHVDFASYKYGCLQVIVACDARYEDYKHSPWMSDAPSRTIGTINEQCFDVFALDLGNSIIKSIRIGAGYDRYFNLTEKAVKIGSSITLNAIHVSNPTWDFMDIENITYKESTGTRWTSTKNNVSISNGSVTGLKVGDALVVAIGEDKSKEFFHVVVTE